VTFFRFIQHLLAAWTFPKGNVILTLIMESKKGVAMPRIDDYQQAYEMGRRALSEKNPDLVAGFSGADIQRDRDGGITLSLLFLNQELRISWPDLEFSYDNAQMECTLQQQILILHYLERAWSSNGPAVTGDWCAFQDIPDGRFYLDAFAKRAKVPLVQTFGHQPETLIELAIKAYGAERSEHGDGSVVMKALPKVPLSLILWKGDDEFPPEGNVLFDRSVSKLLSAEDVAWLAGMVVYPLIGMVSAK
jgi:hypothetical protein